MDNSVDEYKKRRGIRLEKRFDEDVDEWITMKNGEHVPLKDGEAVGGPMKGEKFSDAKGEGAKVKRPESRKQKPVLDGYLDDHGKVRKWWLDEFNADAKKMIKEETGYTDEEVEKFHTTLMDYFGGDYSSYSNASRGGGDGKGKEEQIRIIEDGLARMGAYDGPIYRGMFFEDGDEDSVNRFAGLKVGDELKMRSISSWSSEKWVADDFADDMGGSHSSVIITCTKNKSGVGVQHISKFAKSEAEVLSPSTARWKVVGNKAMTKYDYLMSVALSDRMRDSYSREKEKLEKFKIVLLDVEEI